MSSEKKEVEKEEEEKGEVINVEGGELVADSDTHDINISEEVVATIAGLAAQEVKGVSSLNASGISEVFGMKTKGVKVQNGEKSTEIDISLTVEYGARIPDIAWEVQNRVTTQVESMTGLTVSAVNNPNASINSKCRISLPSLITISFIFSPSMSILTIFYFPPLTRTGLGTGLGFTGSLIASRKYSLNKYLNFLKSFSKSLSNI